jgi:hypothetical protein
MGSIGGRGGNFLPAKGFRGVLITTSPPMLVLLVADLQTRYALKKCDLGQNRPIFAPETAFTEVLMGNGCKLQTAVKTPSFRFNYTSDARLSSCLRTVCICLQLSGPKAIDAARLQTLP